MLFCVVKANQVSSQKYTMSTTVHFMTFNIFGIAHLRKRFFTFNKPYKIWKLVSKTWLKLMKCDEARSAFELL